MNVPSVPMFYGGEFSKTLRMLGTPLANGVAGSLLGAASAEGHSYDFY
jgi:hypothetical protein